MSPIRSTVRWRTSRALALLALLLPAATALGAADAQAYYRYTECGAYSSAQTCYAGGGYHSLERSTTKHWYATSETCSKAVTANQNIKSGSGCSYNTTLRYSYYAPTPTSASYGYWAGAGGPALLYLKECGGTENTYCDW